MPDRGAPVVYRVDADDVITSVGGEWDSFAAENGEPGLDAVGLSLWDAIAGREVEGLYRELLARVRDDGRAVAFPFRCDSPTLRRSMEMELEPQPGGGVEFRSTLVKVEERPAPAGLLEPSVEAADWMIVSCSWCRRFRTSRWVEVEEAIRELDLMGDAPAPAVSHGVCEDCLRMLAGTLAGPRAAGLASGGSGGAT